MALQLACEREREKLKNEISNNQVVAALKMDCSKY